jgi:genome maintenance exonuclease 1
MFNHLPPPVLPKLTVETLKSGIRHYNTPTGNAYPSVTTMLGHKDKPWLNEWRESMGAEKADKEMKRTAKRGTKVHEIIEKYLDNEENPTDGYDLQYIKRFNQLKLFLDKVDNIHIQEAALYSDMLRIAGRVDCIGEYDGKLSVIDFKTSNNNKDREMVLDYFLQTTAYAIMYHEMTGIPIENVAILITVEKGMVPMVYQDQIDKYVSPLLKRIDEYYDDKQISNS